MCLVFQVTDVKKPSISVKRVTEQGNHVAFGPDREDNYIVNKRIGDKIMLSEVEIVLIAAQYNLGIVKIILRGRQYNFGAS